MADVDVVVEPSAVPDAGAAAGASIAVGDVVGEPLHDGQAGRESGVFDDCAEVLRRLRDAVGIGEVDGERRAPCAGGGVGGGDEVPQHAFGGGAAAIGDGGGVEAAAVGGPRNWAGVGHRNGWRFGGEHDPRDQRNRGHGSKARCDLRGHEDGFSCQWFGGSVSDLGNGRAWIDESVGIRPAGRGGGKKTSARGGRGQTSLKCRDEQKIILGLGAAKPVNSEHIDAFD